MNKPRFNLAERFLEAYAESWRKNHQEAMQCMDIEELIRGGISVSRFIEQADFNDRDRLYRDWLPVAEWTLNALIDLRNKGYEVAGGDEFRLCVEKAWFHLERDEWEKARQATPSNEELLRIAARNPPPPEYFIGDEQCPF